MLMRVSIYIAPGSRPQPSSLVSQVVAGGSPSATIAATHPENDYLGIEQYSRYRNAENYVVISALYVQHEDFARQWDQKLRAQGFLEAFTDKSIRG